MRAPFVVSLGRWIIAFIVLVLWAAVGFLPLFGGPGYEAALALGLILPLPVALVAASGALADREHPRAAWVRATVYALALVAGAFAVTLLHGLRVGFCDSREGLLLLLLGPGAGALVAAAWGSVAGLLASRLPRVRLPVALVLAALGPLGGILLSLGRFLSSPMIFAFDPFVGFFAGTLYDTVIDAVPRLLTYRLGSLGTLVCTGFALTLLDPLTSPMSLGARLRAHPLVALLALSGALVSLGIYLQGPALGHYQTLSSIRERLGHSLNSERCEIVFASGIPEERAALLGQECDGHVRGLERYFDTKVASRISVLTFRSEEQKGALMGASRTYIAKPWRNEIYIQDGNYPHPVIGHELAHVVAGSFAPGPFKVAGPLGGWLPDPGRIEGFAVAAAPREDTDQSLLEWSAALLKLNLLPELTGIFRLTFLGENSSKAYTIAGAFVSWFHDTHGAEAARRWYAGAPIEELTAGKGLGALERDFRAALAGLTLPERVLEQARARFDQPAIFGRSCPHVVDRLLMEARGELGDFDLDRAQAKFERSLALDPGSLPARDGLVSCALRRGQEPRARELLEAMAADVKLTAVERAGVWQQLGDRALSRGDLEPARAYYERAAEFAYSENESRTLDVKRFATQSAGRQAIVDLLLGDNKYGVDILQASAGLGAWSRQEPELGLADYLIGRNLYERERWASAAAYLESALARTLPLPRVEREALRLRVIVGCAERDVVAAGAAYRRYLRTPGLSEARKEGVRRLARRCGIGEEPG